MEQNAILHIFNQQHPDVNNEIWEEMGKFWLTKE